MSEGKLILIGGGVRSGKSAFALQRARELGKRRAYLATAEGFDHEMLDRIERHRSERGDDFATIEEHLAVPRAVERNADFDVIVLDCLTIWISNLLLLEQSQENILKEVENLGSMPKRLGVHLIIVTNEVGMGVVPDSALGRVFRDLCGFAHQGLSRDADEVYFAAMGSMLRMKPNVNSVEVMDD
jgi:adenosylcobinamide kinase / adenosylcobinamide-phosphate guanylyltransferase